MKSPKEDYEIRKRVESDPETREDVLNFFSFYALVIYYVFITRSNLEVNLLLCIIVFTTESNVEVHLLLLVVNK